MASSSPRINQTAIQIRQVRWSLPALACDRCSHPARRVWETSRVAVDIDLDQPVVLEVTVSVHHCPACRHSFRAQPPFLRPDATYTNRVMAKAVQSVQADAMAFTRVADRLARDFWVRPSDRMIRLRCQALADRVTLAGDYRAWVVGTFSGILCVDEVYRDRLALLLAVDPASPVGDRLVGYALVHGRVEQTDVEQFLGRLKTAGVDPDEVITDSAAIYPAVLARVWPTATHQLCLFHETRLVTQAVLDVVRAVRSELPTPPAGCGPRLRGRPPKPRPDMPPMDRADRAGWMARVRELATKGYSMRGISRETGLGRNTVRRWMREMAERQDDSATVESSADQPSDAVLSAERAADDGNDQRPERALRWLDARRSDEPATAPPTNTAGPGVPPGAAAPPPWRDWAEIRSFRQQLFAARYLLLRRPDHLDADEREELEQLFARPVGGALRLARDFLEEWYGFWRTGDGGRPAPDDTWRSYRAWRATPAYHSLPPLKRLLERFDEEHFARVSHFLEDPRREATNNGAERAGRAFRHEQAPHFQLRTSRSIEGAIKAGAILRWEVAGATERTAIGRSNRGRRRRVGGEASLAA